MTNQDQPQWTARAYQDFAVDWLVRNKRCILGDDKGLGKTLEISRALLEVAYRKRILILVPGTAAMYVWHEAELPKWKIPELLDLQPTLIRGDLQERKELWNTSDFAIGTYAGFRRDFAAGIVPANWDVVICDEYHRAFKKRNTVTFKLLKQVKCGYFWPLSGSAMTKGPQDLWAVLNLCNPRMYSSYWKFVNAFCVVDYSGFGHEIIGVKNQPQLAENLKNIFLRRTKEEVLPELPPKIRQPIYVDMTPGQEALYNDMNKDMMITLEGIDGELTHDIASTILKKTIRLRQILVSPQLVVQQEHLGWGGAIDHLLGELAAAETTKERHCVIYTPFRAGVPLIRRAIEDRLQWLRGRSPIIELMGGRGAQAGAVTELKRQIAFFREKQGIAICTIQFAESFELDPADTCYFIGYEWDQEQNRQAEDRLHRGTIKWPVNCHYYRYLGTYDDEVMAILDKNVNATSFLMKSGSYFKKILRGDGHHDH
jgi:SNF2 family DNA or RNA helicase